MGLLARRAGGAALLVWLAAACGSRSELPSLLSGGDDGAGATVPSDAGSTVGSEPAPGDDAGEPITLPRHGRDAGHGAIDACAGDCTPVDPSLLGAPRAIAPLSTATATSHRPTFHWQLAPGEDGAGVEICTDRACAHPVLAFASRGTSGAPPAPLSKGLYFWRLRGMGGATVGTRASPAWELVVGARSAARDTSWGTFPDVNGDGYADVLVGAFTAGTQDDGVVYAFLGGPSGLGAPALVGDGGATLSLFGTSVASAGDVNGDGYADVVVGARGACCNEKPAGAAYVFLGGPSGLSTEAATLVNPTSGGAYFGGSVASAGDVNGDGYADVVVGAWGIQTAYVYLGGPGGITTSAAVTLTGIGPSNYGISVSGAGDVNGDGYADVVVGGNDLHGGAGALGLYLGGPGGLSTTPFTIVGPTMGFGYGLSLAGDVNGDGLSDVVVGDIVGPSADPDIENPAGGAFVYFGTTDGLAAGPAALGAPGYETFYMGESVASAGDVNGDGFDDVVVANGGNQVSGSAFLFLGGPGGPPSSPDAVLSLGGTLWTSVGYAGDVNGDGFDDVLGGSQFGEHATLYLGAPSVAALEAVWLSEPGNFGVSVALRHHL